MAQQYDVFISSKFTGADGKPTLDSKIANRLYERLTSRGLKVFTASLTLEEIGVDRFKEAID